MTSRRKLKSNRANALVSTGPRTREGLARSSQNARKHGILSHLCVLPQLEDAEEWEHFRQENLEALKPANAAALEAAENYIQLCWRQRRVARAEAGTIHQDLVVAPGQYAAILEDAARWNGEVLDGHADAYEAKWFIESVTEGLYILGRWRSLDPNFKIKGPAVAGLLEAILRVTEGRVDAQSLSESCALDTLTFGVGAEITMGDIPKILSHGAEVLKTTPEIFEKQILKEYEDRRPDAEKLKSKMLVGLHHYMESHLVPPAPVVERFGRYEAHIARSKDQAFQHFLELQKLGGQIGERRSRGPRLRRRQTGRR
jgi:hypothetical protein